MAPSTLNAKPDTTTRTKQTGTSAVDAAIAKAPAFAQPMLSYLRAVVHEAAPDVTEEIKWSRPFFLVNGTIICQMSAFTGIAASGSGLRR